MERFWQGVGALGLVALMGIVLASAGTAQTPAPQTQSGPGITIRVFQFQPGQLDVKAGSQMTWINQDDIEHTVTSGTPERPDGRFNSRLSGKGATFSVTFTEPGTYSYFCNRHQSMRGQVRVN